jgi:hypothetical protein
MELDVPWKLKRKHKTHRNKREDMNAMPSLNATLED